MNELIKQTFEGQNITFKSIDNVVYVNATEMANKFDTQVGNWLMTDTAKALVEEISSLTEISVNQLVTKKRGNGGGTWMHEDVALAFAQWLSPKFWVWCNKHIKQLLTTGKTELKPQFNIPQTYAEALRLAAEQQEEIERQKLMLEEKTEEIEEKDEVIQEQKPKVDYYEQAMNADGLYTITQIAKEFGYSARDFNKKLHDLGVQYNVNGQWLLYAKYANMGYTSTKTYLYERDGGVQRKLSTMWTEKGRKFIYDLMTSQAN